MLLLLLLLLSLLLLDFFSLSSPYFEIKILTLLRRDQFSASFPMKRFFLLNNFIIVRFETYNRHVEYVNMGRFSDGGVIL